MLEVISALVGAALGSVLTFYLGHIAGAQKEKHQDKMKVFGVLMGGRGTIYSDEVRLHVNLIPVVFDDDEKVRAAYQQFCVATRSAGTDYVDRFVKLLVEISKSLGYSAKVTEADIYTGFYLVRPEPVQAGSQP